MIQWANNPELSKFKFRVANSIGLFPCASGAFKEGWFRKATIWDFMSNFEASVKFITTNLGHKVNYSTDCKSFAGTADTTLNNIITTTTMGGIRRESDSAVIAPSANMNFIYTSDLNDHYRPSSIISSDAFQEIKDVVSQRSESRIEFQPQYSQILHATLNPKQMDDFVVVDTECANFYQPGLNCTHYYKYLVRDLARCDRENASCISRRVGDFHDSALLKINPTPLSQETPNSAWKDDDSRAHQVRTFALEFNLRVAKDYKVPDDLTETLGATRKILKFIRFDFVDKTFADDFVGAVKRNGLEFSSYLSSISTGVFQFVSDGKIQMENQDLPYSVQVARSLEGFSRLVKIVDLKEGSSKHIRVLLTGRVMPKEGVSSEDFWFSVKDGVKIPLSIELSGLKSRKIEAVVKPGLTTYIDLAMSPKESE